MSKKFFCGLMASLIGVVALNANAGTVTVTADAPSHPSAAAVAAGASATADVYTFHTTTSGDILSINKVKITLPNGVSLFNVDPPFGSNTEPPNAAFVSLNHALEVDSWISTPGATALLGADLPGDGDSTFGDLTDDGPQNNFLFATLTVPGGTQGTFAGTVSIADGNVVFDQPFSLPIGIPEPTSIGLAAFGLIGFGLRRRS